MAARTLVDIEQVAADSSSAADIEVVADTEVVVGIVQRQDMDRHSSYADY